jgi:hypothetical protein
MNCTLKEDYLPDFDDIKSTKPINKNKISVWDIDKNDWRAFRVDSVIKFAYEK